MFDNDPEWNECDTNTCQAREGATGITSCVYCGGELIEVDGLWYHWSSFDNQGNLLNGAQVQDYVRNKQQSNEQPTKGND
jgi:hypothetical protein